MKKLTKLFLFFLIISPEILYAKKKQARLSIGAGIYNFMENGYTICRVKAGGCAGSKVVNLEEFKKRSFAYNIEYFTSKNIFKYIKPFVGFLGTTEKAYYSYFGLSGDLYFGNCKCLVVTPSLAAGYYIDGNEIRLGNAVEFRSGGDVTYKFKNNVRIGFGIFHLSNANLGSRNPGSEQFILKYQIPIK